MARRRAMIRFGRWPKMRLGQESVGWEHRMQVTSHELGTGIYSSYLGKIYRSATEFGTILR